MTATTLSPSHVGYAPATGRGFFRRVLDGIIAAREMEARRHIATHLAIYSDEELKELGFTREELRSWRAPGR